MEAHLGSLSSTQGSNSEYVWDDESDESDGGWPTWY